MCRLTFRLLSAAWIAFALLTVPPAQAQTYISLHSFNGQNGGKIPYSGVTIGPGGVLYGTTEGGGAKNYGTVYRLAHRGSGWILTTLYEFRGGSDGAYPVGPITFGPGGYLYGTTNNGGDGDHGTVFRISAPAGPCLSTQCPWPETVMYRFKGGNDGAYPFYNEELVLDPAGNVYGTTAGDASGNAGTVFKLTPSGGGWTETVLYSFSHSELPFGGVTFDNAGNLYGTTYQGGSAEGSCQNLGGCGTVYELTPSGSSWLEHTVYEFQDNGDGANPVGGVIFDPSGDLYGATQYSGGTVYEMQPSNGGWAFSTLSAFGTVFGPFDKPTLDPAGNLYGTVFNESGNAGFVYKLTHSGGVWTETNLAIFGDGSNDGLYPYGGVVLDASGNIYGTTSQGGSQGNGNVWEITP
jgi:uncharacterized repeat protein (TIGR03803 family)